MKILDFAPHFPHWKHAFPEALVSKALEQMGRDDGTIELATETNALRLEIGRLIPYLYREDRAPKPVSMHAHLSYFVSGQRARHE